MKASTTSYIVSASKNKSDAIVPIISLLCQPNVYFKDYGLRVKYRDVIDIKKPTRSEPRCTQSAARAREPARYEPIP